MTHTLISWVNWSNFRHPKHRRMQCLFHNTMAYRSLRWIKSASNWPITVSAERIGATFTDDMRIKSPVSNYIFNMDFPEAEIKFANAAFIGGRVNVKRAAEAMQGVISKLDEERNEQ